MAKVIPFEAFPLSHKTVIVLDRGGDLAVSCQQPIDVDQIAKTRTLIPLAPIAKSLWTCAVESAIEYCRIVWDIHPTGMFDIFSVCSLNIHCIRRKSLLAIVILYSQVD